MCKVNLLLRSSTVVVVVVIRLRIQSLVFSFVHKMCICLEKMAVTGHPLPEYVIRHRRNQTPWKFSSVAMWRTRTRQTVTIIPKGDNAQDMLLNSPDLCFTATIRDSWTFLFKQTLVLVTRIEEKL